MLDSDIDSLIYVQILLLGQLLQKLIAIVKYIEIVKEKTQRFHKYLRVTILLTRRN